MTQFTLPPSSVVAVWSSWQGLRNHLRITETPSGAHRRAGTLLCTSSGQRAWPAGLLGQQALWVPSVRPLRLAEGTGRGCSSRRPTWASLTRGDRHCCQELSCG